MLEIRNYTTGYSKNLYLFEEISIKVQQGEIIGIKGSNGCGKSTFIKGIINLTPIKVGEIYLNNNDISSLETSKIFRTNSIGYLSQRERIFNHLTVSEHIKMQWMYTFDKSYQRSTILQKLYEKIESKKNLLASSLSGGEQLILNLLCLEIMNPQVLLLDEPTDSLDNSNKDLLKNILISWKSRNKSIVLVEQNYDILSNISDYIFTLKKTNV